MRWRKIKLHFPRFYVSLVPLSGMFRFVLRQKNAKEYIFHSITFLGVSLFPFEAAKGSKRVLIFKVPYSRLAEPKRHFDSVLCLK
jgi:hypothetical protein